MGLADWNGLSRQQAIQEMLHCCGSRRWAEAMADRRPHGAIEDLLSTADSIWLGLQDEDWLEAFRCHPRIGESKSAHASERALNLSTQEQSEAQRASEDERLALAAGNLDYEGFYGFRFIVCASGRSASEILANLRSRLNRERRIELMEAAEQQRQITQLRIKRWLER
jgi:2-oxo-4-hydroxy-4-carboxy-5-ureidoimidazoline decarboxylase